MRFRLRSSAASEERARCRAASSSDETAVATSAFPARPLGRASHVLDVDVDGGHAQPGQTLDLVLNPVADPCGDLREVQALLDDDVEVDRDAVVAAADLDSLGQLVA